MLEGGKLGLYLILWGVKNSNFYAKSEFLTNDYKFLQKTLFNFYFYL